MARTSRWIADGHDTETSPEQRMSRVGYLDLIRLSRRVVEGGIISVGRKEGIIMAHGKPRDPRKEQHWRRLIQLWENSGLTVRAFCARHHLSQPSFYAWRRELQQRDAATAFVPVQVETNDQPARVNSVPTIEVVLAGGRCIRVTPGFDSATLRQLLAVLQEGEPC
jgi:transposase-like protein